MNNTQNQIKEAVVDAQQKYKALQLINSALCFLDSAESTTLVDKQYFEEMDDPLTIHDLLLAVAISLESELMGDSQK